MVLELWNGKKVSLLEPCFIKFSETWSPVWNFSLCLHQNEVTKFCDGEFYTFIGNWIHVGSDPERHFLRWKNLENFSSPRDPLLNNRLKGERWYVWNIRKLNCLFLKSTKFIFHFDWPKLCTKGFERSKEKIFLTHHMT